MLLSAVSVLDVVQSSSEIPEGLMNNPVECSGVYVMILYYVYAVAQLTKARHIGVVEVGQGRMRSFPSVGRRFAA